MIKNVTIKYDNILFVKIFYCPRQRNLFLMVLFLNYDNCREHFLLPWAKRFVYNGKKCHYKTILCSWAFAIALGCNIALLWTDIKHISLGKDLFLMVTNVTVLQYCVREHFRLPSAKIYFIGKKCNIIMTMLFSCTFSIALGKEICF